MSVKNMFKKILNNKTISKGVAQGLIAVGWPGRSVVELVSKIEGCPGSIYGYKVIQSKAVAHWSRVASGELSLEEFILDIEKDEERCDDVGTWASSVDQDLGDLAQYLKLGERADKAKWAFDRMKKEWNRPVPTVEEEAAATKAFNSLWDSISKEYKSSVKTEEEE